MKTTHILFQLHNIKTQLTITTKNILNELKNVFLFDQDYSSSQESFSKFTNRLYKGRELSFEDQQAQILAQFKYIANVMKLSNQFSTINHNLR